MPSMTTKELHMFEDQLTSESLAVKKCRQYQSMFTDPVLQNVCNGLASHHQQRFQALLQYLNSHQ